MTHKAFHGVAPVYLCELITKHEPATVCTRRAQDRFLLAVPLIGKSCVVSFFERSFLCAAPTLWNKLCIDIRMLEIDQLRNKLNFILSILKHNNNVIIMSTLSDAVLFNLFSLLSVVCFIFHFGFDNMFV